jgi:hypothetical protein
MKIFLLIFLLPVDKRLMIKHPKALSKKRRTSGLFEHETGTVAETAGTGKIIRCPNRLMYQAKDVPLIEDLKSPINPAI